MGSATGQVSRRCRPAYLSGAGRQRCAGPVEALIEIDTPLRRRGRRSRRTRWSGWAPYLGQGRQVDGGTLISHGCYLALPGWGCRATSWVALRLVMWRSSRADRPLRCAGGDVEVHRAQAGDVVAPRPARSTGERLSTELLVAPEAASWPDRRARWSGELQVADQDGTSRSWRMAGPLCSRPTEPARATGPAERRAGCGTQRGWSATHRALTTAQPVPLDEPSGDPGDQVGSSHSCSGVRSRGPSNGSGTDSPPRPAEA